MENYVSAQVVAEYLEISRRQVLVMTRAGKLPAHSLGLGDNRRVWRYRLSEVDAAIASRASKSSGLALAGGTSLNKVSPATIKGGSPRSRKG